MVMIGPGLRLRLVILTGIALVGPPVDKSGSNKRRSAVVIPELERGPKRLPLSGVVVGVVVQMFPLVLVVAATVSLAVNVVAGQVYSVVDFVTFLGRLVHFWLRWGIFCVLWGFFVSRSIFW